MNSKKIKEIEERVEKATPGTWKVEKYYHDEPYEKYIKSAAIVCRNKAITRNDWSNPLESDLEFIAHARQDIPYLLKIINELNTSDASKEESSIKYYNEMRKYQDELKYFKDLEEQGLLIKLPCRLGDTIYQINYDRTIENYKVIGFEIDERGQLYVRVLIERPAATLKLSYRKEDLYFSREEAEKALSEVENE